MTKILNGLIADLFPYYLISIKYLKELCIAVYKNSSTRITWFITYNFNAVDHAILIQKSNYYGVRGVANNYRYQFVSIDDSEFKEINCGVPKVFILGPFLFIIYINELRYAIKYGKVMLLMAQTL